MPNSRDYRKISLLLMGCLVHIDIGCLIRTEASECSDVSRCAPGYFCDSQTNKCRKLDAGTESYQPNDLMGVVDLSQQYYDASQTVDMVPPAPSWQAVFTTPNKEGLFGIHGVTANAIVAVGDKGIVVRRTNGWASSSTGFSGSFRSTFSFGAASSWACGDGGQCYKTTDGTTWINAFTNFAVNIRAMSGLPSSGELWAVSNRFVTMGADCEGIVYDGSIWRGADTGLSIDAYGVFERRFGTIDTRWVVGDQKTASSFNFATMNWTNYVVSTAGNFSLLAVWSNSPTDVWAVGTAGTIARFDGSNWRTIASPTAETLNAIYGGSSNDIWIVGNNGVAIHWDGFALKNVQINPSENLFGVWGDGSGKFWAVSGVGTIFEYN